ncbi:MAG: DUF1294 domain-containing protein [Parvibaculum sp.]|nr:DUF1294 domain-containing protein [Parvibaculum sp.]
MALQLIFYFAAINAVSFIAFGWDKYCSEHGHYRVPEKTLLTLAAIGGAFGAFAGQHVFRHKTQKEPFRTYLNFLMLLNGALIIALSSPEFRERLMHELTR